MATIVSVASKGGTGKTTVAALMIKCLKERASGPILALDADPDANLAAVLGIVVERTIGDLREQTREAMKNFPPGMSKESYVEAGLHEIIVETKQVDLITMGRSEGPGCYCYINSLLRKFADDLEKSYEWVVMDNEAGLEPISRGLASRIDRLIVVIFAEAVKACKKKPLLNSTTAAADKLDPLMAMAAEHRAAIIGVVMDETGTPKSADQRVEIAGKIMAKAMELGVPTEDVFLDPIAMPMKFTQDQQKEILEAIRQFRLFSDPPPHISIGLSNVSNSAAHKKLINRVFLAMCIANGLDAAICDVMDTDLINTALTAELIMNRQIYADSYIRAG
ncbi:MAG: dihydropteroate synthase [Verrucomicrobiota bacterium]|nr:dihydropteroate synthase [Verrucomicrobiota bacterium]